MRGARSFIIGFCLSLASVSAYGQLFNSLTPNKYAAQPKQNVKIDLFRTTATAKTAKPVHIFANVQKVSLTNKPDNTSPENLFSNSAVNAPEDDEIISVNVDGMIPIEFRSTEPVSQKAEIMHFDDEEVSAMLPTEITEDTDFSPASPWVVAKGGKHIKNKQLLKDFASADDTPKLTDDFILTLENNEENSYKVAEKIKSSLIFPIPSEILNDENLVPTFIKKPQKAAPSTIKQQATQQPAPVQKDLKIVPKVSTQTASDENNSKTLLGSLSSWFSPSDSTPKDAPVKTAPSYSSQEKTTATSPASLPANNNEFVNFYKTLQETSNAHKNNTIIPSELKLSFQPERAEISGQTLRWLKAFSEAAKSEDTYLQVRLDVSASTELQKKRLNLLYTIFMNNGVDFKKIDTVFSLTEPNAFIIRTLKLK